MRGRDWREGGVNLFLPPPSPPCPFLPLTFSCTAREFETGKPVSVYGKLPTFKIRHQSNKSLIECNIKNQCKEKRWKSSHFVSLNELTWKTLLRCLIFWNFSSSGFLQMLSRYLKKHNNHFYMSITPYLQYLNYVILDSNKHYLANKIYLT